VFKINKVIKVSKVNKDFKDNRDNIKTYKKREVRLLFTLTEGFAIPVHSRKTTEIHARYAKPTPPYSRAWHV
jgi:hypothetical protein